MGTAERLGDRLLGLARKREKGAVMALRGIVFVLTGLLLGGCMQATLEQSSEANFSPRDKKLLAKQSSLIAAPQNARSNGWHSPKSHGAIDGGQFVKTCCQSPHPILVVRSTANKGVMRRFRFGRSPAERCLVKAVFAKQIIGAVTFGPAHAAKVSPTTFHVGGAPSREGLLSVDQLPPLRSIKLDQRQVFHLSAYFLIK